MALEQTIGDRIRAMRIVRGMRSARALAERMTTNGFPTTRKQIADWESGATKPHTPAQWRGLEVSLRVGQDYLMHGEDTEDGGDSEFITRLRGLESSLRPRDRRSILALVEALVRENEEEDELAHGDASAGMTDEQRRIADEIDEIDDLDVAEDREHDEGDPAAP